MKMPWLILLAIIAGGISPDPGRVEADRRPDTHSARSAKAPARLAVLRPCRNRADRPASDVAIEDCESAEGVDETWLVHLDCARDEVAARPGWDRPRSTDVLASGSTRAQRPPRPFFLRC